MIHTGRQRQARWNNSRDVDIAGMFAVAFVCDRYTRCEDWDGNPSVLLHYHQNNFYCYEEEQGFYRQMSLKELENELIAYLQNPPFPEQPWEGNITQADLNNVVMHIRYTPGVFLADWRSMPCWVGPEENLPPAKYVISMKNGLLNVNDLLADDDPRLTAGADDKDETLINWTPRWFSTVRLDYEYDRQATSERWQRFLEETFEGDRQRIRLLQMWFGYCLLPLTEYHKFLLAVGDGANGKSVVFEVLAALLGDDNVSHVPLECFGERFGLEATVGKLANIVSEVGELDRVAEGRLKEFVGADRMNMQRKYKNSISVKPTARLMLATNTPPRFTDRSQGVWRRMLLLPFNYAVPPERQDPNLPGRLRGELTGIFNWAITGLRDVLNNGGFIEPEITRQATAEYRRDCDPARSFLLENYQGEPVASVGTSQLYTHYAQWCQANGFRALNSSNLGKTVRQVFPNVERRILGSGNNRYSIYNGIRCFVEPLFENERNERNGNF